MQAELIRFESLQTGDRVAGIVCAWSCEPSRTKSDKPFLRMQLRDAGRNLAPAIMWDTDHDRAPECPMPIYIEGDVGAYQGNMQIKLLYFEPSDHDLEIFVPTTYRPIADLSDEFSGVVELIKDEELHRLVETCLDRTPGFWTAPAAIGFHGAYRGGLLEHTLNVTRVCLHAADIYGARVSQDLLLAGAMLHDIGKSDAYDSPESRNPSEAERMVGHIVRGAIFVEETARDVDYQGSVPLEDILHLILSHHGELEFGAPVKPSTAEALILSAADNLDADTTGYFDYWRDEVTGNSWSFSRQRGGWIRRPANPGGHVTDSSAVSQRHLADVTDDLPF